MPYGYGSANTGSSSSGSSHDRGGGQHRATATRQVAASRARDRHPTTESTGREQAIANRTYTTPAGIQITRPSHHIGGGDITREYNRNINRTLQRRQDYNQAAYQRAHPFLSKLGGIGGLLKGIGKAGLSFFGGLPGQALSGIMTASDYAKRKGSGVLEGIEEFGEHDNLMSYLNRNKAQAIDPVETIDIREKFDRTGNVLPDNITPNMGANNQMVDPNFLALGAAEGGRIGYERGRVVNPGGYAGMSMFEAWLKDQYGIGVRDIKDWNLYAGLSSEWNRLGGSKAQGGIARLL